MFGTVLYPVQLLLWQEVLNVVNMLSCFSLARLFTDVIFVPKMEDKLDDDAIFRMINYGLDSDFEVLSNDEDYDQGIRVIQYC